MWSFLADHWSVILDVICKLATTAAAAFTGWAVWVALKQYKKSAEVARLNFRREAVQMAAQRCDHYGQVIIKSQMELNEKLKPLRPEISKYFKSTHTSDSISGTWSEVPKPIQQRLLSHGKEIQLLLNAIEGFAIPFASNVADDNIGYIECGRAFVESFEGNFPLYCMGDHFEELYQATKNVYWRWKKRLVQAELEKENQQLLQKISTTTAKLNPKHAAPRTPLGCDPDP